MFEPGHGLKPLVASSAVTVDLDPTFILHFLMFTAFVVVMKDLIFDPLLEVFEERDRRTKGAIVDAREMDEQALALKQEFDGKLEGVRRDAAVDRERIRGSVKQLESEMMTEARETVSKTLDSGMVKIDAEVSSIRADLAAQRGTLAATIASKVLGREVRG